MSAFTNWLGGIKMFRTVASVKKDLDNLAEELDNIRQRCYAQSEAKMQVITLLQDEVKASHSEAALALTVADKLRQINI